MVFVVISGLPVTAILAWALIPSFGWRPLFLIASIGALIVWYLRKALPESPRWLEANGRTADAEALMETIEREVAATGPLPPPAAPLPTSTFSLYNLSSRDLLPSMVVGSVVLITINARSFSASSTGCRPFSCSRA
jgi:putative MFS transporter